MVACARSGVIFSPMFAALNLPELEVRIQNGRPKAILTHPDLAERLLLRLWMGWSTFSLFRVPSQGFSGAKSWSRIIWAGCRRECEPHWVERQSPLYLIYTSGSTGPPKGVIHGHGDMTGQWLTARYVLDLEEQTLLWADGDPAWVTGTVYSAFAPWLCGATSFVQGNPFSASAWYRALERHGISVWYTTPMRIRSLMEAGEDLPTRYDFSHLRHISTVGEALLPEAFYWVSKSSAAHPMIRGG